MSQPIVYVLCAATSLACAILLLRGYRQSAVRLLFWSSLCFFGLALENVFLILDLVIFPEVPLSLVRRLIGLASLALLLYGLVWDSK
jgi:hypothetical protein